MHVVQTNVVDIHPLQYLHNLKIIYLIEAQVIDVTPLKHLKLYELALCCNKIQDFLPIQHHKNFYYNEPIYNESDPRYALTGQEVPTNEELKFYNKILSVHTSHKQTREIKNENRITKFRNSLTQKKSYVSVMLNNQIMKMNKEVDILVRFIQHIQLE
ncbi:Hypothetical_protein [Hexamita inflata]|uniref:Hypothetical_protein n=1 Tax=Hexamita inflata TaxID=28002 RepID=A0AA86NQX8_9EUKA|nr:Hypothetical protein HINF_LOCUS11737 [Hexamita inflata]